MFSLSCVWAVFCLQTAEEINQKLNGFKVEEAVHLRNYTFKELHFLPVPQSVDWRTDGLVSPVRNQVTFECEAATHYFFKNTAVV